MTGIRQALVMVIMLLMLASCTPDTRQAWKEGRLSHDLGRLRDAQWWPWTDKTAIPPPPKAQAEVQAPSEALSETAAPPPPIPAPAPLLDVTPPAPPALAAVQPNPAPGRKPPPRVKPVVSQPPASGFLNSHQVLAPLAAAKPAKDTVALRAGARLAPKDLVGLDSKAIERLLGAPELNRREPFAQIWQYNNSECVLFVYLYTVKGGGQQVAHAETGGKRAGEQPDPGACVTGFAERHQKG